MEQDDSSAVDCRCRSARKLRHAATASLSVDSLAEVIARRPIVLLGEVHDNVAQHAARAATLQRLLAKGAGPAIAFEQFDRERQADLDRARDEPLNA